MWIQTLGKLLPKLINLSQSRQHPIVGATPCLRIQWSELKLLQPSTRVTFKTQVAPPTFWIDHENFQLLDMKKSIPIIHEGTNLSWETKYSKYGLSDVITAIYVDAPLDHFAWKAKYFVPQHLHLLMGNSKNDIPYRFVVDSSQFEFNKLIWGLILQFKGFFD